MQRSQPPSRNAARSSAAPTTCSQVASYPAFVSSRWMSVQSSRLSSTTRTLSGRSTLIRCHRGGLVEDEPVEAERLDRLGELLEVDRLANVPVGSEVVPPDEVALLLRGGEDHDRQQLQALVGADPP